MTGANGWKCVSSRLENSSHMASPGLQAVFSSLQLSFRQAKIRVSFLARACHFLQAMVDTIRNSQLHAWPSKRSTQHEARQAVDPHTNVMTTHSIINQLCHCHLRRSGEASNPPSNQRPFFRSNSNAPRVTRAPAVPAVKSALG